jgi:hypothetical protein
MEPPAAIGSAPFAPNAALLRLRREIEQLLAALRAGGLVLLLLAARVLLRATLLVAFLDRLARILARGDIVLAAASSSAFLRAPLAFACCRRRAWRSRGKG